MKATLEKGAFPSPRVEGEVTFDGFCDRPLSEEGLASRIKPTHTHLSVRLDVLVRKQTAGIPSLVKNDVMRLFGDAEQGN